MTSTRWTRAAAAAVVLLAGLGAWGCNDGPGFSDQTPLYRTPASGETSSGERGSIMITEVNFAGSVRDDGTYFADDVFIELHSDEETPVNMTGWELRVSGDVDQSYTIPETDAITTNDYFVIASDDSKAFGEVADVVIPDLELGTRRVEITLVDRDERLMESVGSEDVRTFAGGWDTVSVRSMERVQLLFSNSGSVSRSWHTYSDDEGLETIAEGWREHTLASPGEANSTDYSGSTSTGSFE
jgi:hypothetical protein